jgi:DNA polymerase-3 subunit epsilon
VKRVLLYDTETTGTEEDAVPIEVAVAEYDLEHAAIVRTFSTLIWTDAGNPAEPINRIPGALLARASIAPWAWALVDEFAVDVDAIIAHGADFDRRFVPAGHVLREKPWICSLEDLAWPRSEKTPEGFVKGESLVKLALAHDLGVSHAHRAAVDVDLLGRLLTRVREIGTPLLPFLARGLRPKARFQALVSFERKDEAKVRGFTWEPETRRWVKSMAIDDVGLLPFKVARIGEVDRGTGAMGRFPAIAEELRHRGGT